MSVNKAIILGNLGSDPELRHTSSGSAVARLSVATSRAWLDKTTGDKREETEWHRVTAWGKTAELCQQYLAKGRKVYVEGRLHTHHYEVEGVKRYSTEIVADRVVFCGSRGDEQGPRSSSGGGAASQRDNGAPWNCDDESDIPF